MRIRQRKKDAAAAAGNKEIRVAHIIAPAEWFMDAAGLDPASKAAQSIYFFAYDSIKILLLLFIMITLMGFLRTFISKEKMQKWLSKGKGLDNIAASFFGMITPFCSCSSIPIFLGLLKAGIPAGVSFSFLITSPLVNEYLVVLMLGFFGWKVTLAYVLSGIILGVAGGIILGRVGAEKYLVRDFRAVKSVKEDRFRGIMQRIVFGLKEAAYIIRKIWLWILAGVAVGALIHNYVPEAFLHDKIGKGNIFAVPLAILIGVPMYASCAAIIPVAAALFGKGIPLGVVLAFTMATSALSLPEAVILRRAMKLKLIGIFFGMVAMGTMIMGYIFNLI